MKLTVKSIPEIWEKEERGDKPNTVRHLIGIGDIIEVVNTKTGESFERDIRDLTEFEGRWIISWDNEWSKMGKRK